MFGNISEATTFHITHFTIRVFSPLVARLVHDLYTKENQNVPVAGGGKTKMKRNVVYILRIFDLSR